MSKKNCGTTYYSFEDLAVNEFGMKPLNKRTKNTQKLEMQREQFEGVCIYCKQRARYVPGTNIVACINPECKGKKIVVKGDPATDEPDYVKYIPFVRILNDNAAKIADTIFD